MVHFQLLWSDEPVTVIQSDGIDANEIENGMRKIQQYLKKKLTGIMDKGI